MKILNYFCSNIEILFFKSSIIIFWFCINLYNSNLQDNEKGK